MKVRAIALSAAALFLGLWTTTAALADTVYSQPVILSDGGYYSFPNDFTAYDNFALSSSATVTSVDWYGTNVSTSDPTSFTISFYSDSGGVPGTLLSSTVIGNGSPVYYAVDDYGYTVDSYSSAITPFIASAGTQYWMSIFDNDTDNEWAWEAGTGGDGMEISIDASGNVYSNDDDLAFTLNGSTSATPEPSSLILLGTGLLGAVGIARRRFLHV